MLHKTRGIVLNYFIYNDKYSIAQIYTEEFGKTSYVISNAKSKNTRHLRALFHPLSVLDLEVEHKNSREIQRLKEIHLNLTLSGILFNPIKSVISLFIAEFIGKIIREIHPNKEMFDFIYQSIFILNLAEKGIANFHLVFVIQLSRFLGFYPNVSSYEAGGFFDMQSGVFTKYKPIHPYFLEPDDGALFLLLLRMNYENMHVFAFSRYDRVNVIRRILEYYSIHLYDLTELKSLDVLQNVFE